MSIKERRKVIVSALVLAYSGSGYAGAILGAAITKLTSLSADAETIALIMALILLAMFMVHVGQDHNWRALLSVVAKYAVIGGVIVSAGIIVGASAGGALIG